MILKISYYGDPVLRKKGEPIEAITPEIVQLAHDMVETMEAHNGIGLAAPQVGRSLRLFIVNVPLPGPEDTWIKGRLIVCINPKILSVGPISAEREEGCLSIPKTYGHVSRPTEIEIEATDLEGNRFTETLKDLEARCFLHENDHINGVLFLDRLDKKERLGLESQLKKIKARQA